MNWITNIVRPRIKKLIGGKSGGDTPENLWKKCPSCGEMIFHRDLNANLQVCPKCGYHMRIGPAERFAYTFDPHSFSELPPVTVKQDPLQFRAEKRYADEIKSARAKTSRPEAFSAARGTLDGLPVIIAVQPFDFLAGSLGMGVGESFVRAAEAAVSEKRPFILFVSSGGARMQESMLSLMQMPRTTIAVEMLREAGLPYIVVLTDPTFGGVSASYAMLGDIQIAEPGAQIGFAGARVIAQTIREKLPEGFQRAEYLLAHGMLDMVVPRADLRATLSRLAHILMKKPRPRSQKLPPPARNGNGKAVASGMNSVPRSTAILSRMLQLHPKKIDLVLDRMLRLLGDLGNPQLKLPPVIHVAGTNGKGSACAFSRAMLEAQGLKVHMHTSPHLVRFHERIRIAGKLISEEELCDVLEEVERVNDGAPITFFEITGAAMFLAFSRHPADAVVLEVGLGGRYDATNVIPRPAMTIIQPVGLDHQEFLGDDIAAIAAEKAGIIKPKVPVVIGPQDEIAREVIQRQADRLSAPVLMFGQDFHARQEHGRMVYEDETGLLDLPLPKLIGRHQVDNAGVAIAGLRHAVLDGKSMNWGADAAVEKGLRTVDWPARLQHLTHGPLVVDAPDDAEIWLDGGHNPHCAAAVSRAIADLEEKIDRPLYLICGMLKTKDAVGFLSAFRGLARHVVTVSIPGEAASMGAGALYDAARAAGLDAAPAEDLEDAMLQLSAWARAHARETPPRILICGSLYLAGQVLQENG